MSPLGRHEKQNTVSLKARKAEVVAETEVLVVGGGPAGFGAALGAASAGAKTMLVERYGFLGGNATAAMVMPIASYHAEASAESPRLTGEIRLFPPDHGQSGPVIAGAVDALVQRLVAVNGAIAPTVETGYVVPFDPEIMKTTLLTMLSEAKVKLLLHSFASQVIGKNLRPEGVVFETKSGPVAVKARAIVDATGDGDVATYAGAQYEIGRPEDGRVQPMSIIAMLGGFDRAKFSEYVRSHPGVWSGVVGLRALLAEAKRQKKIDVPRDDVLLFDTLRNDMVALNATRVTDVNGTSVMDLTRAEIEGRRQLNELLVFLKEFVPGFEQAFIVSSGVIGVRETRRFVGEYTLTEDDVLEARKFPDAIARGAYPIDIHDPAGGSGTVLKRVPDNDAYDIPLRCLLPCEAENLLLSGRNISGTHEALSSYRVMPISIATGQAAGVCAAFSARNHVAPRVVSSETVRNELLRQGANLGKRRQAA